MQDIILIALLALLAGWAVWRVVRKARRGGGCCGDRAATEKRVAVRDRNPRHYPNAAELRVEGMVCENCARRVGNALNALDGVWATVRLDAHQAIVRGKRPLDEAALRDTVRSAGYTVTEYRDLSEDRIS